MHAELISHTEATTVDEDKAEPETPASPVLTRLPPIKPPHKKDDGNIQPDDASVGKDDDVTNTSDDFSSSTTGFDVSSSAELGARETTDPYSAGSNMRCSVCGSTEVR